MEFHGFSTWPRTSNAHRLHSNATVTGLRQPQVVSFGSCASDVAAVVLSKQIRSPEFPVDYQNMIDYPWQSKESNKTYITETRFCLHFKYQNARSTLLVQEKTHCTVKLLIEVHQINCLLRSLKIYLRREGRKRKFLTGHKRMR